MPPLETIVSPDDELAGLSEFALLREDARSIGLYDCLPPVERVAVATRDGEISALRWGDAAPRLVLLHGGGENAHAWDTTVLATGLPAVAVDLPGHGRSAWRTDGDYTPATLARALGPVLDELAPAAELVVGAGLGGLAALQLAASTPHRVRRLVVLAGTARFDYAGRREFPTFEAMLEAGVARGHDREQVRRALLHDAHRLPDGCWAWRHDPRGLETVRTDGDPDGLSTAVEAATVPTVLVRGSGSPRDADVPALRHRLPAATVRTVPVARHAPLLDAPEPLSRIVFDALADRRSN